MNLLKNKKALINLLKHGDVLNTLNGGRVQVGVSVKQHQNEFVIKITAPGVSMDAYDIMLDLNRLNIAVNLPHPYTEAAAYHPIMTRTFNLPAYVDTANIVAHYQPGQLQIILPFQEITEDQRRKIDIKHL